MQAITKKMKEAGLPDRVIEDFLFYRKSVQEGVSSFLRENDISPLAEDDLVKYEQLSSSGYAEDVAIIKLNGGLGTSMGLTKAKSLIKVKGDLTFLDIIAKQIQSTDNEIPLILMNSFATEEDSLKFLNKYNFLTNQELPLSFLQNKYPRLHKHDLSLCDFADEQTNWSPPGHGDIYTALETSGLLGKLLDRGVKYAFISNADNLGAYFDTKILHYFAQSGLDLLMEVCTRTPMDKKGGHLAKKQGKLILREVAQTMEEDLQDFQNIDRHSYFNTNSLWLNLQSLKAEKNLRLPQIVNPKIVEEKEVVQLETAMGSAISVFPNTKVLLVPRTRFMPVKKTNDLLLMRSDFFTLDSDFRLIPHSDILPTIELNSDYYGTLEQIEEKFKIVPSLKSCASLTLKNEYLFDKPQEFTGNCIL